MNRITKLLKKIKSKGIHSFFLMLCIPIFIAAFFHLLSNYYYIHQYRNTIITNYTNDLNTFIKSAEDKITNLSTEMTLISSIPAVQNVTSSACSIDEIDSATIRNVQSSLYAFRDKCTYLDDISIVNRSSGFVINSRGTSNMDNYFTNMYKYENYDLSYWKSYNTGNGMMRVLTSSNLSEGNSRATRKVIPVVFPVIGASQTSLIIFNVNPSAIFEDLCDYSFTENTERFMIDVNTGENIDRLNSSQPEPDIKLVKKLNETNYYYIGDLETSNGKSLIISSQARSNIFAYTYIIQIPYKDITDQAYNTLTGLFTIITVLLLSMLIYAQIGSKALTKPWVALSKSLGQGKEPNKNEIIEHVTASVSKLLNDNKDLKQSLLISLSYSQQKYLIELLDNTEKPSDPYMDKIIFKHNLFVSVAINVSFSANMNSSGYVPDNNLFNEINKAIQSVFASRFNTFSLPGAKNTLYLILNLDSDNYDKSIENTIDEIRELFVADENYLTLYIGRGGIYNGIEGLRRSHSEAVSAVFESMNTAKVQLNTETSMNRYSSGIYNENILINHLLSGHTDEAEEFVNKLFASCQNSMPEVRANTYNSVFIALDKVTKIRGLRVPDFEPMTFSKLLSATTCGDDENIKSKLLAVISHIADYNRTHNKNDLMNIADYINEHYTENLYLDMLAEEFNTTPKYISKVIKQQLGSPFKTYLTQLRLTKAEELLVSDGVKISDIYEAVGFSSHAAFIRAFKQKNGVSPSDYRKLYSK